MMQGCICQVLTREFTVWTMYSVQRKRVFITTMVAVIDLDPEATPNIFDEKDLILRKLYYYTRVHLRVFQYTYHPFTITIHSSYLSSKSVSSVAYKIRQSVVMYAILGILGHIPHYPFRHCHQDGDRPIFFLVCPSVPCLRAAGRFVPA